MNKCLKCSFETTNPRFCSRSCAASYNNSIVPRRKPEHKCKACGSPVPATRRYCSDSCKGTSSYAIKTFCKCGTSKHHRSIQCQDCKESDYALTTIGELRAKSVRHAQVYNSLRQRSRRVALATMELKCLVCQWDAHVEVCHLRALSTLPDSTSVEEATGKYNFVLLCPNHHWELDHNNLDLAPHLGVEPS